MKPTTPEEMDSVLRTWIPNYDSARRHGAINRPRALEQAAVAMFMEPDRGDSMDHEYVRQHLLFLNKNCYLNYAS